MASPTLWADFETLRHNVKLNTVDRLKQILTGFNEECHSNFTKSGKKQELIDRITREMDGWRSNNNADKWMKGQAILNQVRATGSYNSSRTSTEHSYASTASPHNSYPASTSASHSYHTSAPGTSSAIPRYDPYAPPRRPAVPPAASSSAPVIPAPTIRFKPSPFFRVERAVSAVVECPESTNSMDRRQQSLTFTITNDVLAKLSLPSPKYQLRLYCTSSAYHSPTGAFRSGGGICPIEFPPTCEVRVNGVALTANLKGMKKKPGTAPPPDLGKSLRLSPGATNRVEMVYVNSQQPVQSKKFYLVVMLVETTSVDQLIGRLKKGKYKSSQEIMNKMALSASADDDIVAGHQKMSLKCPLSYMRISTPCRSSLCVHAQCFDAFSWYSLMEQTTTWLCPVCEKVLNVEDLIVDGYFDEILQQTPEDVEDVIVEANGQWHTEDNKYGSAGWKATHPSTEPPAPVPPPAAPVIKQRPRSPAKPLTNGVNGFDQLRPSNAEIVILDSDDEDEGRVKRELSPSNDGNAVAANSSQRTASQPSRSQTQDTDVIDLTLDSEDEEAVPLMKKRKNMDDDIPSPTEQIWKKSRADVPPSTPSTSSVGSAYSNGSRYPGPILHGGSPSTSAPRYPPPYNPSGAQPYSSYYNAPPVVAPPRRPPPANPYLSRINGNGSSSPETWRA